MLQGLLATTALFKSVKDDIAARMRRGVVLAVCAFVALIFVVLALIAIGIGLAIAIAPYTGGAWAAVIVGLLALAIAGIVLMIGLRNGKTSRPPAAKAAPLAAVAAGLAGAAAGGSGRGPSVPWVLAAVAVGLLVGRGLPGKGKPD